MAEGFLKSLGCDFNVFSAGTEPTDKVHPLAVKVMAEVGVDISSHKPKNVHQFLTQPFDYVITVCDHARETCPVFIGTVKQKLHVGFKDPSKAVGSEENLLRNFREVRDQILEKFSLFHSQITKGEK